MGNKHSNDCPQPNNPDFTNPCSNKIGETHTIPGYCGNSIGCRKISSEWTMQSEKDCKCNGLQVTCVRQAFNGDPKTCCVNDYDENKSYSNCFSDPAHKNTCDPKFRSVTGTDCRSLFIPLCVDVSLGTDENFMKAWNDKSRFCGQMIKQNVRTPANELRPKEDITWARQAMAAVFDRYFSIMGGIGPVGGSGKFQDQLYSLCLSHPEACEDALTNLCAQYSPDDIGGNENIANFCGCHLPSSAYAFYTNLFSIPKECTPMCADCTSIPTANNADNAQCTTIQWTNEEGKPQICRNSTCIIDDVTFNYYKSQGGNIDFSQICGGCEGSSSCQCYISGVSIKTAESELSGIDLSQNCKGALNCYRQNPNDPNGQAIKVDCDKSDNYIPDQNDINNNPGFPNGKKAEVNKFVTIALLVLFLVIILIGGLILLLQLVGPR